MAAGAEQTSTPLTGTSLGVERASTPWTGTDSEAERAATPPTGIEDDQNVTSIEAYAMEIDRLLKGANTLNDSRMSYVEYLTQGGLPTDRDEARRIHRRTGSFMSIEGELCKRSISGIIERCITTKEGIRLLKDVHGGIYGYHSYSLSR